jgi:hypothetical protein
MSTERKPIPGFDGRFEIDLAGNVYAMVAYQRYAAGRTLRTQYSKDGYVYVVLYANGKSHMGFIHRLLMITFNPIENAHEMEVNHIDLDKGNNSLTNLEWLTHQANIQHAHRMNAWGDNQVRGEHMNTAKLIPDQVREIRRLHATGMNMCVLGRQFKVTPENIRAIVYRQSWRHIE